MENENILMLNTQVQNNKLFQQVNVIKNENVVEILKTSSVFEKQNEKRTLKKYIIIKNLFFIFLNLIFINSYSQKNDFSDLNKKTVDKFLTENDGFVLQNPIFQDGFSFYSSKKEDDNGVFRAQICFKNEFPLFYEFSFKQSFSKKDEIVKELKYELIKALFDDEINYIKQRNIQFEKLTDSEYTTKEYTINDIKYYEDGKIGENNDYYYFNRNRVEILDIDKYQLLKEFNSESGLNIINVSTFNIEDMIKFFIEDLEHHVMDYENNNLDKVDSKKVLNLIGNLNKIQISATFEEMNDETLAISYGINNDSNIFVKVNPAKWSEASNQKKWYIIYHELGHDVLNFLHGEGDKMMFNFIDKKYTWGEFFEDRKKMFDIYISKKL
jgi:hypothetical protein